MSSEKRTALIRTAIPVILLIIFYTMWLQIDEIYGIIAGIIMLVFLFMRSATAPKEERLPIGEFCVLMLGVVRIISDIKLRHYFTAICGVPLLFVLYAVLLQYQKTKAEGRRLFTDAHDEREKRYAKLRELDRKRENALNWKQLIPAANEKIMAQYNLDGKRAFVAEHGVMPSLYERLPAELKNVNPREYEKQHIDQLVAYVAKAKENYLSAADKAEYKADTINFSLTNEEFIDVMDNASFLRWNNGKDRMQMEFAIVNFRGDYEPFIQNYFSHIFSYAVKHGYYSEDEKEKLMGYSELPWKSSETANRWATGDISHELRQKYKQIEAGMEGEKTISDIAEMIRKADASAQVLCGITLKEPGTNSTSENDIILVCSKGVFTIEVKNWNGRFIVGDDGIVDAETGETKSENPVAQSKRHAYILSKILKGIIPRTAIHPSVFMVNEHCTVSTPTVSIPVYAYYDHNQRADKLLADIAALPAKLNADVQKQVSTAIISAKTQTRKYSYAFPNFLRLELHAKYMYDIFQYAEALEPLYYVHLGRIMQQNGVAGQDQARTDALRTYNDPYRLYITSLARLPDFIQYFDRMAKIAASTEETPANN